MRGPDEKLPETEDRLIGRLVDGELSPLERRELLARLDSEPDGWRRCALAFLEDQAWRESLGGMASFRPATEIVGGDRPRRSRGMPRRVALAASLLTAFVAGWGVGGFSHPVGQGGAGPQQVTRGPGAAPGPDRVGEAGPDPRTDPVVPKAPTPLAVGVLSIGGPEEGPEYRVPILAGPGIDESWLLSQPPALPDQVRHQLERLGYRVERQRRLVSMELDDGGRLAIPVDEVELDYVGQVVY